MPFNFHVPLPGPFSYSRRIGGRRRPRSSAPGPGTRAVGAGLDRFTEAVEARGLEAQRRRRDERVAQGLPPDPEPGPATMREALTSGPSFAELVAERKRVQAERAAARQARRHR